MQELFDGAVIVALSVLRIGVPIALTLALGRWLERKLQADPSPQQLHLHKPSLASGQSTKGYRPHCWDLFRCDTAKRAQCAAYRHPDLPCWLALQVEGDKLRPECFTCELYRPQAIAA